MSLVTRKRSASALVASAQLLLRGAGSFSISKAGWQARPTAHCPKEPKKNREIGAGEGSSSAGQLWRYFWKRPRHNPSGFLYSNDSIDRKIRQLVHLTSRPSDLQRFDFSAFSEAE